MIKLVTLEEVKNNPLGFPIYRKVRKEFDIPGSSEAALLKERTSNDNVMDNNNSTSNEFYNKELADSFRLTYKIRDDDLETVRCDKGVTVVYGKSIALNTLPRSWRNTISQEDKELFLQTKVREHINRIINNKN